MPDDRQTFVNQAGIYDHLHGRLDCIHAHPVTKIAVRQVTVVTIDIAERSRLKQKDFERRRDWAVVVRQWEKLSDIRQQIHSSPSCPPTRQKFLQLPQLFQLSQLPHCAYIKRESLELTGSTCTAF